MVNHLNQAEPTRMRNDAEGVEKFKKGVSCLSESVDVPEQCIMKKTDESMRYQEISITDVYENLDTVGKHY